MYQINNFTDNDDIRILDRKGPFTVIEYKRDLSVTPQTAAAAYYCNEMNVRKRQVVCVPPSPTRPPSSPSTPATAPWCWSPPTAICC